MTKKEFQELWALVKIIWPNNPNIKSNQMMYLWELAMSNYRANDVKQSLIRYARKFKYWPDISDIVGDLDTERPEVTKPDSPPPSPKKEEFHIPETTIEDMIAFRDELREIEWPDKESEEEYKRILEVQRWKRIGNS